MLLVRGTTSLAHATAVCIGELAAADGTRRAGGARAGAAKALSPTDRTVWEKLRLLYVERLLGPGQRKKRTSEMEAALREIETYYGGMKQQFPRKRRQRAEHGARALARWDAASLQCQVDQQNDALSDSLSR